MRISTLFTVASLFLIGSFSLPQPENLEATQTIEDREAKMYAFQRRLLMLLPAYPSS